MAKRKSSLMILAALVMAFSFTAIAEAKDQWVVYQGKSGPGKGKHIVLMAGDEEYRSEEILPQLGKILAVRHGFKCTVVFSINPKTGEIDPNQRSNTPGLEALKTADLFIIATRFRDLPDKQMKHIDDYLKSGRPVIGMRTATHGFQIRGKNKTYAHYSNGYRGSKSEWRDGFGRLILGEKWISHHGRHGRQATRGILVKDQKDHPILRGIKDGDIFGLSDVYGVRLPLPGDSKPLVLGQVVDGMKFNDPPAEGKKNNPMMPVSWTKSYQVPGGKKGTVFTTTMGAATDMVKPGSRRMIINAAFWCVGLEKQIKPDLNVDAIGVFKPTNFGFNRFIKGVMPAAHKLK